MISYEDCKLRILRILRILAILVRGGIYGD